MGQGLNLCLLIYAHCVKCCELYHFSYIYNISSDMILRSALFGFFCLMISAGLLAQPIARKKEISYHSLSMGVGVSLAGTVINSKLSLGGFFGQGSRKIKQGPVYGLAFEKRINRLFGLGGAFSYQSIELIASDFFFLGRPTPTEIHDYYKRSNYSVRGLIYMVNDPKFEIYWALRLGYTFWDYTSTSPDENYIKQRTMSNSGSGQLVFGMRYFPGIFGFGYELGIGSAPYVAMVNVSLKFE
jgi:hypothetical protein